MNKLKPLPKTITKEIRSILEGCRDGRLQHDQTNWTGWRCGTAHCIAGWKTYLDQFRSTGKEVHETVFLNRFVEEVTGDSTLSMGDYAARQWKLSPKEASTLFNSSQTLRKQFALLEKLESGERVA